MNELTQERSHLPASIVKNALATHQLARNMKDLTQDKSRIHASFVKKAFAD